MSARRKLVVCVVLLIPISFYYFSVAQYGFESPQSVCVQPSSTVHLISILNESDTAIHRPPCYSSVTRLLNLLYHVDTSIDHVTVPESMAELVRDGWFHGNDTLYTMFRNPVTLTVTDRFTAETTNINIIRSMRPKPGGGEESLTQILKLIEDSRSGCNFCDTLHTLEDSFGRVKVTRGNIFTAENSFRFHDYSGLVIPGDVHNFMDIDYPVFEDMIVSAAIPWFRKVHSLHPANTHPILVWDVMRKAGASQVHPHIHTLMGKGRYPGKWGLMDMARARYHDYTKGRNYLQDMVDLHVSLGLGVRYKSAAVIASLTPVKDNELWVIGTGDITDWTFLHFLAYRTFVDELGIYCFSQSMALPTKLVSSGDGADLMVAKIGSRGDCTSSFNDVSALELYSVNSVATDFFETMRAFKRTMKKFGIM